MLDLQDRPASKGSSVTNRFEESRVDHRILSGRLGRRDPFDEAVPTPPNAPSRTAG
ncbi:MAG: hypothetical protein V2I63_03420 [Pseudomonadales bacterium]|jgi:hypothetical protein|nr:hypothetical protein [Pseudomonadales bacterium]